MSRHYSTLNISETDTNDTRYNGILLETYACIHRCHFEWSWVTLSDLSGVFSDTTQLNLTQLTQLNSVQPSQSCFCLWRHDLQTESTRSLRSLIGDSCSRCERVDNSTSSWVELYRYKHSFSEIFNGTSIARSLCDSWDSCLWGVKSAL